MNKITLIRRVIAIAILLALCMICMGTVVILQQVSRCEEQKKQPTIQLFPGSIEVSSSSFLFDDYSIGMSMIGAYNVNEVTTTYRLPASWSNIVEFYSKLGDCPSDGPRICYGKATPNGTFYVAFESLGGNTNEIIISIQINWHVCGDDF